MKRLIALGLAGALTACGQGSPTWTLYRNGVGGGDERIHMATFDADDTGGGTHTFNEVNCEAAAQLFYASAKSKAALEGNEKPPVTYWCEEGIYRESK